MEYSKLDDNTLQVSTQQIITDTQTYTLEQLYKNQADAEQAMVDYIAIKKAEIADTQVLIDQCEKLGIKTE